MSQNFVNLGGHEPVSLKFPFIELKIGEWDVPFTEILFVEFCKLPEHGEAFCFPEVRFENTYLMNGSLCV